MKKINNLSPIAFLGPEGTFTEEALLLWLGETEAETLPLPSIAEVVEAVRDGRVDKAVVPLENSIEGPVNVTLDKLASAVEIQIQGEIILPIKHHLLAKDGVVKEQLNTIISHPQALAQCRYYLGAMTQVVLEENSSTAGAAEKVAHGPREWAAIGTVRAAELYGLKVLEEDIQDSNDNTTRFIVLGRGQTKPTGKDLTSLVFSAPHRPGGLFGILAEFASRGLNLTKIESRPAKKTLGEYLFFVDLEGHCQEAMVKEAVRAVSNQVEFFRVLGSYPKAGVKLGTEQEPPSNGRVHHLQQLREDIDSLDRQIIELLAQRADLVKKVGRIKKDKIQVRDPKREEKILAQLTAQAVRRGLEPAIIEGIYRFLFEYFVSMQQEDA